MKPLILFFFSLLFINLTFSQEGVIKITNQLSHKEITIKENKRIRIKTVEGEKISGRFKIIENGILSIKGRQIKLADIQKIKRNPVLLSVISTGVFIYIGAVLVIVGVATGAITSESGLYFLAIPGAGMIYAGLKSPNVLKGYKTDRNWTYELLTTSDLK